MIIFILVISLGVATIAKGFMTEKPGSGSGKKTTNTTQTIVTFDPGAPPVPGAGTGVATNGQTQTVPGQQPSPTGTPTATAVTINGDVRIENLSLAIAVGGGTAATSTIEKKWYDMPPTRYDKMLDDDGGRKVVGAYEDVVFTKPNGWGVIPEVVDAKLGTDFLAMKNKGTHDNPEWVEAMGYHYPASEFRLRSLRYPVKVRFVLIPTKE